MVLEFMFLVVYGLGFYSGYNAVDDTPKNNNIEIAGEGL